MSLGEPDVRRFPWLEPPPESAVQQAGELLRLLGAIDDQGVTELGQVLARLPVHPRLARLLVEGRLDNAAADDPQIATNVIPLRMTREEMRDGWVELMRRLYDADHYFERFDALFVDGRYTLQAPKQVETKAWAVESLIDPPPESWVTAHLKAGDRLGFDPWLHTFAAAERLSAACAKAGAELVAVDSNPVDAIWQDRPQPPLGAVAVHGLQHAGTAEGEKLAQIKSEIDKLGADALVL